MFASLTAMAQRDSLPYAAFPPAPDHYSSGTVVSRLLDGLGFRYYWATEGLRPIDLTFRPGPEARTSQETLEHIYSLSNMIISVFGGNQIPLGQYKTFGELLGRRPAYDVPLLSFNQDDVLENAKIW